MAYDRPGYGGPDAGDFVTDTPEVNDIPAILARANAATEGAWRAYDERGVEAEVRSIENGQSFRMARLDGWENNMANAEFIAHSRTDVPNMAAEILSLRADRKRLDVLEETFREGRIRWVTSPPFNPAWALSDQLPDGRRRTRYFPNLTEAADAEFLSRREKENG